MSGKYFPVNNYISRCYHGMIDRCYNKNSSSYGRYGKLGVKVCDEWRDDYQAFLDWALANGWAKGLQLDKDIKAYKLGLTPNLYSPERCSFVTPKENARHRKSSKKYLFEGIMLTAMEISEKTGIKDYTLSIRLKSGMPVNEAIVYDGKAEKIKKEKEKVGEKRFHKLKEIDIINIREKHKAGMSAAAIHREYYKYIVCVYHIQDIVNLKTWKHLNATKI